jgi:thiol:disulfide interchange protein DsbC
MAILRGLLSATLSFAEPENNIKDAIVKALPQYQLDTIEFNDDLGLYKVTMTDGLVLHFSENGRYFMPGDVYQIEGINITNQSQQARMANVENVPLNEMVVFAAKGEEKGHITVFTDVDCGYCRMLHKEVDALNDMGISVRYLAYPRAGVQSEAYKTMVSIWCSDDPQQWMTKAKLGQKVPANTCDNPIAKQYQLGNQVGVKGTPSILLSSGDFIPGYIPAVEIAKRLGLSS